MNKAISFFLGLLFGIMVCVFLFYFDVRIFKFQCPKCNGKEVVTHVKTDTVFIEPAPKPKKQYVDSNVVKKVVVENLENDLAENETSIYETEFSLEDVEEEAVFSDLLLQTKTAKVKILPQNKQEVKLPDDFFQYVEIQQWSTPIKNKITYYRDKSMIKIKGIATDNVNVVFWNDAYFLEIGNRYYAIPETKYFEKLNPVQIPQ
jgi:hypothetical protein